LQGALERSRTQAAEANDFHLMIQRASGRNMPLHVLRGACIDTSGEVNSAMLQHFVSETPP
jgi:hypothetical protein